MSQERLTNVLVAAVEAATAHSDWQDGDEICVIFSAGEVGLPEYGDMAGFG